MLILAYHRVNPEIRDGLSISPDMLNEQLTSLLDAGWTNVLLEEHLGEPNRGNGSKSFAITFDDGYQDNYMWAAPVLEGLGLRATIYVVSTMIDSNEPFPWLDLPDRAEHDPEDLHMTSSQIEDAARRGVFHYGSHTLTHPFLTQIDPGQARREIEQSRTELQDRLGMEITTFCYPAGDLNDEVVAMVREAGYAAAVVTPNRYIPETRLTLHRIGVYSHMTPRLFSIKTHPLFERAQKSKLFWRSRRALRR